ncbi:sperm-associated antigen 4 protein isoform X1 [Cavia porcellus]|uniref:sperm-associated antigen 4 protein isoform X1 n=1 Tax=Cavia porcellus TaxID=10141 RepID=UPI002FE106EF
MPQWSPWALAEPAASPAVSEEQRSLLAILDLRREMPALRATKSFLSLLFQVPRVLLLLVRDALLGVCREVCSVHFLSAASLLSVFLAGEARIPQGPALDTHFPLSVSPLGLQSPQPPPAPHHSALTDPHARKPLPLSPALSWSLLHLLPPLENEPKAMLSPRSPLGPQSPCQSSQSLAHLWKQPVSSAPPTYPPQRVAKLVFQRLNEDFVQKPDYALSSVGATIDLEKTSHDYEDTNMAYFWNRFSFWNYARPPTVILEPDVFPGNCWAFQGHQGQVVIRLAGRVQLSDITLQHPPPSVAHTEDASSAPRDFAVFGLQVDDKTEVFLGRFTFDVKKFAIQTFHLQNDSPSAFPKVKIQILSNWGHPRFTCLYRVRAHGLRISEGEGSATGATRGPH